MRIEKDLPHKDLALSRKWIFTNQHLDSSTRILDLNCNTLNVTNKHGTIRDLTTKEDFEDLSLNKNDNATNKTVIQRIGVYNRPNL